MLSWKWNMPDHFYPFAEEHVTFISLESNMNMLGLDWVRDQREWFEGQVEQAERRGSLPSDITHSNRMDDR